jgi:hypothetical protein
MPSDGTPGTPQSSADAEADFGHPRGTLAIVAIFGALFALGFFALFILRFLERGAPHH